MFLSKKPAEAGFVRNAIFPRSFLIAPEKRGNGGIPVVLLVILFGWLLYMHIHGRRRFFAEGNSLRRTVARQINHRPFPWFIRAIHSTVAVSVASSVRKNLL